MNVCFRTIRGQIHGQSDPAILSDEVLAGKAARSANRRSRLNGPPSQHDEGLQPRSTSCASRSFRSRQTNDRYSSRSGFRDWRRTEYLLDPFIEHLGDPECQRQARFVAAGFNRVHRLTRHTQLPRQIALGPTTLRSQIGYDILHLPRTKSFTICPANTAQMMLDTHAALRRGKPSGSRNEETRQITATTTAAVDAACKTRI